MFRYGVLSIPVAALISSVCPGYALCAVPPAALPEKAEADQKKQGEQGEKEKLLLDLSLYN